MKVEIIAEMAQGFEGSYSQAKLLVKAAASAGANAVKFQLVYADELATNDYLHYNLFKSLEMSDKDWNSINKYSEKNNIQLYLDIFGNQSLDLCQKIGVKTVKLHPTDITNISLLKSVSKSKIKKVILGIGGANFDEIEKALLILKNKKVDLLLGFQSYPTENRDNHIFRYSEVSNLALKIHKNFRIGFADHANPNNQMKFAIACTAVGAGYEVLEKHLTLGKVMEMEDHESALNPDEFKEFVYIIRECTSSLGLSNGTSNDFNMSKSEKKYRKTIRRHVVSTRELTKGNIIKPDDVCLKRTSESKVIYDIKSVYNKRLKTTISKNKPIPKNAF